MNYLVRFDAPRHDGGATYLRHHNGEYRVGASDDSIVMKAIPMSDATCFSTEDAAYSALGRFLARRPLLSENDWIANPRIVMYEPKPLCSVIVEGCLISLVLEGGTYCVRTEDGTKSYSSRGAACDAFAACIDGILEEQGL